MAFKKGHKLATGGKRDGSGRKPDEFKQAMRDLADSPKFHEWLRRVIEGELPVHPDTRLKAWREARDSGYGKPVQGVELGGNDGQPVTVKMIMYGDNPTV